MTHPTSISKEPQAADVDTSGAAVRPVRPREPAPTPEHIEMLSSARTRGAKLFRTASVAAFNGWATAIFAGITVLSGLFSPLTLLLGLAMAAVAWREFKGAARLRRLDPGAPRALALNQAVLGAALVMYWCIQLMRSAVAPTGFAAAATNDPQLQRMMQPIERVAESITVILYAALIGVALLVQGGTALYYHTREKHLARFLRETPTWIVAMYRSARLAPG